MSGFQTLSLQGRGKGVAKRRQGEGVVISNAPIRQALTLALRAVPLPYRERASCRKGAA